MSTIAENIGIKWLFKARITMSLKFPFLKKFKDFLLTAFSTAQDLKWNNTLWVSLKK